MRRRTFLTAATAAGLASFAPRGENQAFAGCGSPGAPLPQPGRDGYFARWPIGDRAVTLEARMRAASASAPWTRAFAATDGERNLVNPMLVLERGQRVDLTLANAMRDPTIVHWHGLTNDTRNDGALGPLVARGASFRYAFEMRDRAGLYWYHPHPHGATAGQAYDGLFGVIEVGDDEDRALRRALDVAPGETELVLVLQDRKPGGSYAASDTDRVHGHFGPCLTVNGVERPQRSVATRGYRLRILNASNARTYRLAFTTASGERVPFALLGTDGGLLARATECREAFVSTAERVDLHVDFSGLAIGETVTLETLAFDPMHVENAVADKSVDPHAGHGDHAGHGAAASAPDPHAGHGALAEGVRAPVMTFAVRTRATSTGRVPAILSSLAAPAAEGATERPLRLGFAKGRWRINDRVFEMGSFPIEVARGARELWLFRNYHTSMPHAMHLHGFPMRVVARETSPDFIAALAVDDRGRLPTDLGRKDTVLVWPGETVRAFVDFAHPWRESQDYLVHCHNLEHEDGGMMLGVRVG
ncbi:MAG TPA: multicopper oxidase family protein [Casimicrobiaceae bacterium]|jgi:suppressor of ftsI/bilirubin oxidase